MESRNPSMTCVKEVWAVPFSLAATNGITVLFYFLPGTKMFQFPDLPRPILCIQMSVTRHNSGGVAPFGDPRILVCNDFPWHFAVYCVLHRLLTPRYPPCALRSLTKVWMCSLTAGHCRGSRQHLLVEFQKLYF